MVYKYRLVNYGQSIFIDFAVLHKRKGDFLCFMMYIADFVTRTAYLPVVQQKKSDSIKVPYLCGRKQGIPPKANS